MSICTSSDTTNSMASQETSMQSGSIAPMPALDSDQPADDEKEQNLYGNNQTGNKEKGHIYDTQMQQVKRRKEEDGSDSEDREAFKVAKCHPAVDDMTGNMSKLIPSLMEPPGSIEKASGNLKQPFIVTGHIVESRPAPAQSRETKITTSSSNSNVNKISSTISNNSTNIVVKNNRNNNLWKSSNNHVVKFDSSNNILSKTSHSPMATATKKTPSSRPVAGSISALYAGNQQNQASRARPLLINHDQGLHPSQDQHNNSNQQLAVDNKNARLDTNKTITTTLSSQLFLSSIITANSGFTTQQLVDSGNLNGLQFCLSAGPQGLNVAPAKVATSIGGDLTYASPSLANMGKPMSSVPNQVSGKGTTSSSPFGTIKTKSTKPIGSDCAQTLDRSASSASGNANENASGNAAAARLLDLGKRLLEATKEGKVGLVRELVVDSGAPFTSDWLDTTALHIAAQNGFSEIAEILIQGGINKDARTKLKRTPLHLAAQSGSLEVVDLLIRNGSDVNCCDMLKMTPLHWAVERRHICVVRRLLMANADYKIKSKFQLTPLDIAKNSSFFEIVELFKVSWPASCVLISKPSSVVLQFIKTTL